MIYDSNVAIIEEDQNSGAARPYLPWRDIILWSFLAGGLPFLIYLRTLAPTVYGLDSAELSTGAYMLGIVHAPGSPTYLLIGHLFTKLPFGDVGYRLNLLSACAVTVALIFMFHIAWQLTQQKLLSLLSTWWLAFTYYVWIAAVAAELYALQGMFTAVLLWLALQWQPPKKRWPLPLFAFCYGLGLGVHLSLALLLPGFLILLWSVQRPWQDVKSWAFAFLAGSLGLLVYLYLPLRSAATIPFNQSLSSPVDLTTWDGFWWMVTARMFAPLFFGVPPEMLSGELATYLFRLWSNFLGIGLLMGLWGMVHDWRKRPYWHTGLLLMLVVYLFFYFTYRAGDKELMFLPTYLIGGVWLALGVNALFQWQPIKSLPPWSRFIPLMLLMSGTLLTNYQFADVSDDWSARDLGERILAKLEPNAVYMGTWADVPILQYLQVVEGYRPDVVIDFINPNNIEYIVETSLASALPVYVTTRGHISPERYNFQRLDVCNCYQVNYGASSEAK